MISDRIRKIRTDAGLSQLRFAQTLSISRSAIANSKVEKTSHPNRRCQSSKNIFSLMQTGCVLVSVNHIHQRIAEVVY